MAHPLSELFAKFSRTPAQKWVHEITMLEATAGTHDQVAAWLRRFGFRLAAFDRTELAISQRCIAERMRHCPNNPGNEV